MIQKILHKIRRLLGVLLDKNPSETSTQQKIIAVGDNNIIIIGDNHSPNSIVAKNETNVKHFPPRKS